MNKLNTLAGIVGLTFLLYSFSANPPDGFTGAPGNSLCSNCHSPDGTQNQGTITVEGFPASITPEQTYILTVVNRNTNDGAVKAGFQMTILSPTNTRAGDMTAISANAVVSASGGRQYFEHNPAALYPDSNVVRWMVQWKAPSLASGSKITWYAGGVVANGNQKSTGDRIVASNGSGFVVLSGTEETVASKATIYPNPGSDIINIEIPDQSRPDGQIRFYDISGKRVGETMVHSGSVNVPVLAAGLYFLEISTTYKSYLARWSKI
jgi:hypothetical protein